MVSMHGILRRSAPVAALLLLKVGSAIAQQPGDTLYLPEIPNPAYPQDEGPIILIDEGHYNAHVVEGSDRAFAAFLRADGYQTIPLQGSFTRASLDRGDVLVIPMPLAERNRIRGDSTNWFNIDSTDFSLPNPSAFTAAEIESVYEWVLDGGRLLVVADHMPSAGAVSELALAFGLQFSNGHAQDPGITNGMHRRTDGNLLDHAITNGRDASERVDSVRTYGGSAFTSTAEVEPLLVFGPGSESLEPTEFRVFTDDTPRVQIEGWYQGAALRRGRGRAVFLGEAGMFFAHLKMLSACRPGPTCRGEGPEGQNRQYLLNTLHWLSGLL